MKLLHLTKVWMKNPDENLGVVIRVRTNTDKEMHISPVHRPDTVSSFGTRSSISRLAGSAGQIEFTARIVSLVSGSRKSAAKCRPPFLSFQMPYLQINIRDSAWKARTKRTTNRVCSEDYDPDVTSCCMWPLTIDFAEFGWDWVLFPKSYEVGQDVSILVLAKFLRQKMHSTIFLRKTIYSTA